MPEPLPPHTRVAKAVIAEQHEDTRVMLRTWLVMNGFEVTEAADGDAAVAETLRTTPDVLLIDASLPKIDSLSVVRKLRSCDSGGRIPIVLMSDYTGITREVDARAAGCDAFVAKPIDLDRLLGLLHALPEHDRRSSAGPSNGLAVALRPARSERLKNHTEH